SAGAVVVLGVLLARVSASAAGYSSLGGYGRSAASLVNLLFLFVPLLGLSMGAAALVHDKERATLGYLLAQPVSVGEVYAGKAIGASAALCAMLLVGLGVFGAVLAASGVGGAANSVVGLSVFALLLGLSCLALGMAIGAVARRSSTSTPIVLGAWVLLAFLFDLAYAAAAIAWRPSPSILLAGILLDPLEVFRIAAISWMHGSAGIVGPVGELADHVLGASILPVFAGILAAWCIAAHAVGYVILRRWRP
ncbi:MAG: ABC transporter permease subunit, partial [Candidatus Thermoplasmatota archaeon]